MAGFPNPFRGVNVCHRIVLSSATARGVGRPERATRTVPILSAPRRQPQEPPGPHSSGPEGPAPQGPAPTSSASETTSETTEPKTAAALVAVPLGEDQLGPHHEPACEAEASNSGASPDPGEVEKDLPDTGEVLSAPPLSAPERCLLRLFEANLSLRRKIEAMGNTAG